MIKILKLFATLAGFLMDIPIGITKLVKNAIVFIIVFLISLPLYYPLLAIYMIAIAIAENISENKFKPEDEGLKSVDYYFSYGQPNH